MLENFLGKVPAMNMPPAFRFAIGRIFDRRELWPETENRDSLNHSTHQ